MPEVFLKAVSIVRNLGHELADFTTVNLDFLQHYRPRVNVVERPHAQAGGRGYSLTGPSRNHDPAAGRRAHRMPTESNPEQPPASCRTERPFWGFAELLLVAALFLSAVTRQPWSSVATRICTRRRNPASGACIEESVVYAFCSFLEDHLFARHGEGLLESLGWVELGAVQTALSGCRRPRPLARRRGAAVFLLKRRISRRRSKVA